MNAEHQALAKYLGERFNTRFDHVDERLNDLDRSIRNLTNHVDRKNNQPAILPKDKMAGLQSLR